MKRFISRLLPVVFLVSISGMLSAAEFSASVNQTIPTPNGAITTNGKMYVSGLLQRHESSFGNRKSIMIIRPDKGVIWTLMPEQKNYMEQPTAKMSKNPPSIESILQKRGNFKKAGTARIAGYDCVKYTFKNTERNISGTVYISTKLQ